MSRLFCLYALLAFFTPFGVMAAPRFTATLDRTAISVGESATLSLAFEGGTPDRPPAIQAPANLTIAYSGQSSQFTLINGQARSTLTHSYRVTAAQPGDYVIPAIQVVLDNQTLSSRPLTLKVLKRADGGAGGDGLNQHAFLRLVIPKTAAYVGEVLPLEIQLYVLNPHDLNMPQIQAEGFTLGTVTQPTRGQNQVGNAIYQVFTFKVAATPAKAGTLSLGPVECNVVLRYRKARDPSDLFGDLFGGGIELRQATLAAQAQPLEVLPLPKENQPPDFTGAVGNFSIAVNASPTNAVVGDPITLRIQISGQGALDSLALPSHNDWHDFKVYPPNSKVETTDTLGLTGVKSFEQVVIPQNAGVQELPAIAFSYFDPQQKSYRTIQHPAIPLSIQAASSAQPQPTVVAGSQTPAETPPMRDIVHIKPHFGLASQVRPPLIQQAWFLALQGVPLLVWLASIVWRKQRDLLANDPKLRRRRHVSRWVRRGLQDLRGFASANQAEQFFATVFRLLQEQLGERLDLPASAITEAVVDERLRQRGVPDELVSSLHALFALCNQARYAPQRTTQELMALVPQVESAIRALAELRDAKSP